MLDTVGVSKYYGGIRALSDVTISVGASEVVALVGENGAGKSTFVRCVARATTPDAGTVSVDGLELGRRPRDAIQQGVSVVWQDLALCENLDVTSNLFLGRELANGGGLRRAAMHSRANQVFASLNVTVPELDRPIERLSGGQRQLVAIARATLDFPKVLILDEPTAALGIAESRTVLDVIKTLRSRGVAILLVSHQLDKVFDVADRIVVLRHGEAVADLHRAEAHPDDIVALITGVDVDTMAGQQLRRLHSLAEQLADAEQSSVLPLTVSSLSAALDSDRLAIFLTSESQEGTTLRCSASLHLPPELELGLRDVPVGVLGGFLGRAAQDATLVVVPQLRDLRNDPVAKLAVESNLRGAWAAPVFGQHGTLAVIVGFTDSVAQLRPEQVQLLELFSTMAGAAIERGQLVESLRLRNQSLEGLHGVLETLAGPNLLFSGMSTALDAVCRGVGCEFAALFVQSENGQLEERAASPGDAALVTSARAAIGHVIGGSGSSPGVTVTGFEWSRGPAALVCFSQSPLDSDAAGAVMTGAANSFRLAMERELTIEAEQESAALQRSRAIERALTHRLGHELRTPLTAIQGFASTLLQTDVEWPETEKQRFVQIIEAEAGRMGRLVAQLFDDSAIESGTLNLDFNYCNLAAVVTQAAIVGGPTGSITTAVPQSLTVFGDADRIQQVLVNLIQNALQHNPAGTKVHVGLTGVNNGNVGAGSGTASDRVVLSVEDNGHGLPGDVMDYLNGVTNEVGPGRGLGTRLVRGFVVAHGGIISATANEEGTRIEIELPIEAARS